MKLTVCPFSVGVFFATAALLTLQMRTERDNDDEKKRQQQASETTKSMTTTTHLDSVELPVCTVVFVLGAPGVGKGTQCEMLTERLKKTNWVHLSAGDLLRAERKKGDNSSLAKEINACIAAGQLVKSEVTCKLLENGMKEAYLQSKNQNQTTTHFLIDGFPRSHGNATAWATTMSKHNIQFVLDFTCPEEILTGRLLERGAATGRSDDNIETIRKRFDTFQKETAPILEYYKTQTSVPVYTIQSDKPKEDVYQAVVKYFE